MTIYKAFTSYGKRFFMLPAVVIPVIACSGSQPPQLLWWAPFIVRFAYQQTSDQGLPCLPVAKTLRGTRRPR